MTRRAPLDRIGQAVLALGIALIIGGLPQVAAPVLAEGPGDWQVWLDHPIPKDAPPGSAVHLGFIAWETDSGSTVNVYGFEVRLHPKTGKGAVSVAQVSMDWPGHSAADLVVPAGGFGRLEFGVLWGDISRLSNSVSVDFRPIPVAGVGPPPGISIRRIGTVRPTPSLPAIAGQPLDVDLTFEPRVDWPAGSLPLPTALTLRVRLPGADAGQEVAATLVDRAAARYRATVVLDRPGPYILEPAMAADAPAEDRFTESEVRVVAEAASGPATTAAASVAAPIGSGQPAPVRSSAAQPGPAEPGPTGPDPLVIGLAVAALALVGGFAWVLRAISEEG